jgi:toxin YoeB
LIGFEDVAFEQYNEWEKRDKKIFAKVKALISEVQRDPFHGTGKPEPLKGNLSGYWSRRITHEHRLVYRVFPDYIVIASCKDHY